jgi:DinB superfamily
LTIGERAAHGWNPPAYAELLGIPYSETTKLAPAVLAQRLDIVLDTNQQLMRIVPDRHMNWRPPERNRTLRNLGYHVFRLSLAFVDGMDMGEFPESWLLDEAPDDLPDGPAIARYGALVRGRVSGWFEGASPSEFQRVIKVYYGPQSGHDLLERTTWHAAQHLRQLYVLAERLGITPPVPMPVDAFKGLPLPDALW